MENSKPPSDLADLRFLCEKAQCLLDQQITSFDQTRQNSGVLLTVLTFFLPFFLNGIGDSVQWVQAMALFPTTLIIVSVLIYLGIFGSRPLDRGVGLAKYQELVRLSHEETLLQILGGIIGSFADNKLALIPIRKRYEVALLFTKIVVITSALVLITNQFVKRPEKVTQVHLTNPAYVGPRPQTAGDSANSHKGPGTNRTK